MRGDRVWTRLASILPPFSEWLTWFKIGPELFSLTFFLSSLFFYTFIHTYPLFTPSPHTSTLFHIPTLLLNPSPFHRNSSQSPTSHQHTSSLTHTMASKEATIYILDVGPSLKTKREGSDVSRLEETKKVLLKLLANKVLLLSPLLF